MLASPKLTNSAIIGMIIVHIAMLLVTSVAAATIMHSSIFKIAGLR